MAQLVVSWLIGDGVVASTQSTPGRRQGRIIEVEQLVDTGERLPATRRLSDWYRLVGSVASWTKCQRGRLTRNFQGSVRRAPASRNGTVTRTLALAKCQPSNR